MLGTREPSACAALSNIWGSNGSMMPSAWSRSMRIGCGMRAIQYVPSAALACSSLRRHLRLPAAKIRHSHRQNIGGFTDRLCGARSRAELFVSVLVLDEDIARLPWQLPERTGEDHGLDRRVPAGGGIVFDLDRPEAMPGNHD